MAETAVVGRDELFHSVEDLLGRRRPVVLSGRVGVGKSRFAQAIAQRARADGLRVVEVRGDRAARETPLGVFAFLIGPDVQPDLDVVAALWKLQTALLGGDGRRTMVYIDDAHQLDPVSAMLAARVARASDARMLLTVRQGEDTPGGIVDLWSDGTAERVTVGPLDRDSLEEMVGNLLGHPLESGLAGEFWRLTEGNPLCAHELAMEVAEGGGLVVDEGRAGHARPLSAGARTHQVIESRLAALADDEVAALRLLATVGWLPLGLLEATLEPGTVGALERRDMVSIETDGMRRTVRTGHPLYGEIMAQAMGEQCRRTAYDRLFDAARGLPMRRQGDATNVADWGLRSNRPVQREVLAAAAREAMARQSPAEAERFARAAGVGEPDMGLMLANALAAQGRVVEAEAVFERLLGEVDDQRRRAEIGAAWGAVQAFAFNDPASSLATLSEIEATLDDPVARDVLAAQRAAVSIFTVGSEAALSEARPVIERHPPASADAYLLALGAALSAAGFSGRVGEALDYARRARAAAGDRPDAQLQRISATEMMQGWALAHAGRPAECVAHLTDARLRHPGLESVFRFALGAYSGMLGRHELSDQLLASARAGLVAIGDPMGQVAWGEALQLESLTLVGDEAGAAAVGHLVRERSPAAGAAFAADILRCLAVEAFVAGREAEAQVCIEQSLEAAARVQHWSHSIRALDELARFGDASDAAAHADPIALAAELEWVVAHGVAAFAHARADGDGDRLAGCATEYAQWGWSLRAAEIAAEACEAFDRSGRPIDALREEIRSRAWQNKIGRCASPILARRRSALGERAHEIAELAASGMSNRVIADHLVLSSRTVENHLYRSYSALGVSGREELAGIFHDARAAAIEPPGLEETVRGVARQFAGRVASPAGLVDAASVAE